MHSETTMKQTIIGFLIAGIIAHGGCGCVKEEGDDTKCVFEGRYDIGYIAYESSLDCSSNSVSFFGTGEDSCSTEINQLSVSGARQIGYISCDPADPVVECSGYVYDDVGCQWDAYVRRVVP